MSRSGSRWRRHGSCWPSCSRAAARRDRHAFDPLSRSDPAACSAIPRACTPRRSAIRIRHGADPYQRDSRLWRRGALRDVDQSRPHLRPQTSGLPSSASTATRARRTQARPQPRLSLAANRTIVEIWPKGETEWVEVPCAGEWFPDAFIGRMANVQRFAPARMRS